MILQSVGAILLAAITATGYAGLFLFSLAESCAIPIPSEIIVPFSGFLAVTGRFNIIAVILVATLGNWIGSLLLYAIGRGGGRWLLERYGHFILVSHTDINHADQWFSRHGSAATFWSRLIPIVRTFISLPAGISRMNIQRFSTYTIIGSVVWNSVLAYIGYSAGKNWDVLHPYFQKFDLILGIVIFIALVWYLVQKLSHRHV